MSSDFDARLDKVVQRKEAEAKARAAEEREAAERAVQAQEIQQKLNPVWHKLIGEADSIMADINGKLAGTGLQLRPPHSVRVGSTIFHAAAFNAVTMGQRSEKDPYLSFAILQDGTFTVNMGKQGPPVYDPPAEGEQPLDPALRDGDRPPTIEEMTGDRLKSLFVRLAEEG